MDDAALQRLKRAGASDSVLAAIKAARGLMLHDILKLLRLGIDEETILKRWNQSPRVLTLDAQELRQLQDAGASPRLVDILTGKAAGEP